MAYATQSDMERRFGADEVLQLADRDGDSVHDAGVIDGALNDASAEIDAYLAGRYALPLASTPPLITRIACDIARYRLWDDHASEEVRRRYEDARRLLGEIAAGRVTLGLPDAPAVAPGGVAWSAPAAVFDESGMSGF